MSHSRKIRKLALVAAIAVAALGVRALYRTRMAMREYGFRGMTMGTFYSVKIAVPVLSDDAMQELQAGVDELLRKINRGMSTYDPNSDISRFNSSTQTTPFTVSEELARVVSFSLETARCSGGAFDPTVKPLVTLWGFDTEQQRPALPGVAAIAHAMDRIGYRHLSVPSASSLRKDRVDLAVDLGAVAKGYGVDRVAAFLRDRACSNILVEIGGEIMAFGHSARARPWRIAIETPKLGTGMSEGRYEYLLLNDVAVATSGDYRNYFENQGKAYSHIIDPRTGWPVSNHVASVTVIAGDCMTADALATALTVLGPDDGIELIENRDNTEALFIIRNKEGTYTNRQSSGLPRYIDTNKGQT